MSATFDIVIGGLYFGVIIFWITSVVDLLYIFPGAKSAYGALDADFHTHPVRGTVQTIRRSSRGELILSCVSGMLTVLFLVVWLLLRACTWASWVAGFLGSVSLVLAYVEYVRINTRWGGDSANTPWGGNGKKAAWSDARKTIAVAVELARRQRNSEAR